MRTVLESLRVSLTLDDHAFAFPRLEDAYMCLQWWLARNPESGELIDRLHWAYKQEGSRESNIPSLVALYTFTEHEVDIIAILVRLPE